MKTKSRTNAPPYARSSKLNNQAKILRPMQEVSSHIKSMSWPEQRSRKARNSDALSASAKTTKKAVTGRNKRRRLARFKIVKQKSQEGQTKRMNIRTKETPAAQLCRIPAPLWNSMIGSHFYTVNQDCIFNPPHTHTNNQLLTAHHFNTSTISPSPLSVLLTGLLSRSLFELLLVDMVSERLGLVLLLLVLAGLRGPTDIGSISLRAGKFEGVCVVDMLLEICPDPFDLCHVARSSTFLASPDRTRSRPSSQLSSSRMYLSRLGDK